MKPGTHVRMTEDFKRKLMKDCTFDNHVGPFDPDDPTDCWNCSHGHVKEFGDSVGVVIGPVEWNVSCASGRTGPELHVRWLPGNLQYIYFPSELEVVEHSPTQMTQEFMSELAADD